VKFFYKKLFFFFCIALIFLFGANFVLGLEANYPEFFGKSLDDDSSIGDFVCYFFNAGLSIAITLCAIIIAFGGIYYLVSYGRGKFTSEAKDWIKAGILGLLIIVCSSLVIYTINPNISSCKIGILEALKSVVSLGQDYNSSEDTLVLTYDEIPIGVLTENLLTRAGFCSTFDRFGDPLPESLAQSTGGGVQADTSEVITNDRVDCLRRQWESAIKKTQVVASLSDEIVKLMNTCDCSIKDANGKNKCEPVCNPLTGCQTTGSCPNGSCTGNCINGLCQQANNSTDCCPTGVKEKIEHGPIFVPASIFHSTAENSNAGSTGTGSDEASTCFFTCNVDKDCGNQEVCDPATHQCGKIYKGLDEFRCDEENKSPHGRDPTLPNEGKDQCHTIRDLVSDGTFHAGTRGGYDLSEKKWKHLTLLQQMTWFEENIDFWGNDIFGIQHDIINLKQAKNKLNSCYNPVSAMDIVAKYQVSEQKKTVVLKEPTRIKDWQSNKLIDSGQYCKGFNYNNSSCLEVCNNSCPESDKNALAALAQCAENSNSSNSENGSSSDDESEDEKNELQECVKNAMTSRSCPYGDGYGNFEDCISSCRDSCHASCVAQFSPCTAEFGFCASQCANNGQCVLDNLDKCVLDKRASQNAADCAEGVTGDSNIKYCVDNSFLCKDGSQQYSGYYDCIKPDKLSKCSDEENNDWEACQVLGGTGGGCVWNVARCDGTPCAYFSKLQCGTTELSTSCEWDDEDDVCSGKSCPSANAPEECNAIPQCEWFENKCKEKPCTSFLTKGVCNSLSPRCSWIKESCTQDYSASYLYENKDIQKCLATDDSNSNAKCQETYPETSKCPTASNCPYCPCNQLDETFKFTIPNGSTAVSLVFCTDDNDCFEDQVCEKSFLSTSVDNSNTSVCKKKENKILCDKKADCHPDQTCVETCYCPDSKIDKKNPDVCLVERVCNKICMHTGKNDKSCNEDADCSDEEAVCSPRGFCISNAGQEGYSVAQPQIVGYQMVGPQCTEYAYNGDPLTFYCQKEFWNDPQKEQGKPPTPIGSEKNVDYSLKSEIPVGQTVDDALAWANKLVTTSTYLHRDVQRIVEDMRIMGKAQNNKILDKKNEEIDNPAKDYCKCNAKLINGDPICTGNCKYAETLMPTYDDQGTYLGEEWQCSCNSEPCKGNPCQQMINYHSHLWNDFKNFKREYINYDTWIISEPRSDILKELTYSRQQIDSCNVKSTDYGLSKARLLSCSKAERELVPPINTTEYLKKQELSNILHIPLETERLEKLIDEKIEGVCYGQKLGLITGVDIMDNWFCVTQWADDRVPNNNPIYNIENNNF
jgi:hypothetical protein